MKSLAIIVLLSVLGITCRAQKNDYIWLSGYGSEVGYDSATHRLFGTSVLDFNYTPIDVNYDTIKMNFDGTNSSYCDDNGNLILYTNGIYIANRLDEKIKNSDSLNAGVYLYVWNPAMQERGYRLYQGSLIINFTLSDKYYLFHSYRDTLSNWVFTCKNLLYTTIDMSLEGGHGEVVEKNKILINDTLGWELAATKHANGRDWWLLMQKRNTNCYYRVLITSNGINVLPDRTCGGISVSSSKIGGACFSPDGSKYVYLSVFGGASVFDFDRCSGMLSNPVYIPIPVLGDSGWITYGVAISPNNRFLYVGARKYVFQYDLLSTNVIASVDTVAVYDGYGAPFASLFHTMQMGPDGKIYESCDNGEKVYHVIERPDEKGDSCMFIQHGVQLPTFSLGVPNFPNYRLGALPGSPCDTLTGLGETERAEKERLLKVFPNPATDFVTIDYGFTDWSKGGVVLEIVNELGQVIHSQNLPMYSGFQKIDVSQYSAGIYSTYIKRGSQVVSTAKFARQ